MKCNAVFGLLTCLALSTYPARLDAQDASQKARLDAIVNDPAVRGLHGGAAVFELPADQPAGKSIYSLRADELFVPASNIKLLTTAAALDQLGPEFKFATTFALRGDDLLVFAGGDAGLGDERLARKRNQPLDQPFRQVAAALKKLNVTRIAGDLVVDATVFDDEYFHPNWPADQRDKWYQAEVGGLNFNDNCIDLRSAPGPKVDGPAVVELVPDTRYVKLINKTRTVNEPVRSPMLYHRHGLTNTITASGRVQARAPDTYPVPICNPPAFAAQVLLDVLAREGVTVAGKTRFQRLRNRDGSLPGGLTVLHRHEQELGELVWRCNTFSQNFVAECLFKALGAYDGKSAEPTAVGSWATGRAATLAFIARQKLPAPPGLLVDDGSGVSKSNLVSPGLLAELLVRMAGHKAAKPWIDSLATAGEDGTLRKRFRALTQGEQVLAKTGTLANAVSLSGYVFTKSARRYAFAILFDKLKSWSERQSVRQASDRIVAVLLDEQPPAGDSTAK